MMTQSTFNILEAPLGVSHRWFPSLPPEVMTILNFVLISPFFFLIFTNYVCILKKCICLVFSFLSFIWVKHMSIFGDYFCPTVCNFPHIKVKIQKLSTYSMKFSLFHNYLLLWFSGLSGHNFKVSYRFLL